MEANDITLQALINAPKQYIIPVFQRYYSWEQNNWETLWSDISVLAEPGNQERTHFMGSLVFFPLQHAFDQNPKYQVIDGQQRLVTFSLILSALRYLASEHQQELLVEEIEDYYLIHKFKKGEDRYRVYPRQRDREEYLEALNEPNLEIEGQIGTAFNYFTEKIADFIEPAPAEKLREFFNLLKARLQFVYIQLDGENPYEIFKSLNSKGVPLSQADLIRNFVFMNVDPDKQDDFDDDQWRLLEKHFEIESGDQAGELDAKLATRFFRDSLMKKGKYVPSNDVFGTFEEEAGIEFDPFELAVELKQDADFYDIIRGREPHPNAQVNASLEKLRKLDSKTTYPLLLALLEKASEGVITEKELSKAIELISGFIMRRYATSESSRGYGRWFVAAAKELGDKPLENLNRFLFEKGYPNDKQFQTGFTTFPWYVRSYAKVVLEALERASEHKEPADLSKATIEHIMPQTLTEEWREELGKDADEIQEEWLHTIGNLTLSAYNPELFNHPYPVKQEYYADSNITLNRDLARYDQWRKAQIKKRAAELADVASTIWIGVDEVVPSPAAKRPSSSTARNDDELTPRRQLQLDFWTTFNQYLEAENSFIKGRKPRPSHYTDFAIGRWEFGLGSSIYIEENRTNVDLVMTGPDAKRHFQLLLDEKEKIEEELGTGVEWNEFPAKKNSYITLRSFDFNPSARAQWPRQHAWLKKWLEDFYNCFHPRTEAMRTQPSPSTTRNENGLTPRRQLQLDFWTAYMQLLESTEGPINTRKAYAQHWADFAIGRREFWLGNSIVIDEHRTDVYLGMQGPDAKRHFKLLLDDKEEIEAELGVALDWHELPDKKSSYIYLSTNEFDSENREQWPEQQAWMQRWLEAFHNCFHPRTQAMRDSK